MFKVICVTILFGSFLANNIDYFDPTFDQSKNCKHKELMVKLKDDSKKRCSDISTGSDSQQWEECKKVISQYLASSCPNTKIEKVRICFDISSIIKY